MRKGNPMTLRDILVILDDTPRNAAVVQVAIDLARQHDAHATGLCPLNTLLEPELSLLLSGYTDAISMDYLLQQTEAQLTERAAPIEAAFREQLRRNDVRGYYLGKAGPISTVVASHLRTADLAVMGQVDPSSTEPLRHVPEDVILIGGRPVLMVPFAGRFDTIGKNVLIAWRNTREAARAMNDALPLLLPDATVTVLSVQKSRTADEDEIPSAEAVEHLARHGLKAIAARTPNDGSISDSDAILSYASDLGADLIVAGCYGHSRMKELILGGVSRSLLQEMTVPVLMSH